MALGRVLPSTISLLKEDREKYTELPLFKRKRSADRIEDQPIADPPVVCPYTAGVLMAVVVWISSSQIAGTFQRNFVLWCRAAGLSFCCRLRLASSLLRDFVGRVGIGAAN